MQGGPYHSAEASAIYSPKDGRQSDVRQLYVDILDQLPGDYADRVEEFDPGDTEVAVLRELEGVEDVDTIERVLRRHGMI